MDVVGGRWAGQTHIEKMKWDVPEMMGRKIANLK